MSEISLKFIENSQKIKVVDRVAIISFVSFFLTECLLNNIV